LTPYDTVDRKEGHLAERRGKQGRTCELQPCESSDKRELPGGPGLDGQPEQRPKDANLHLLA